MVSLERLSPSQLKRFFPFSLLEEPELNRLIPLIEVVNYPKGSMIYSSGDIPDAIYFIVSGEIQLMLQNEDSNPQRLTLTIQDHFGDEALSSMDYRLSGALATSEVSLLRISRSNLRQMQTQFSLLRRAFRLMLHSFKHQQHLQLPWLGKQEKILLITRKHSLFLILRVLLTGGIGLILAGILLAFAIHPGGVATGLFILAIFILLLGVFLSIWAGLEWTNDYFILTEDRVVVQKKMVGFFDSRQEAPFSAILSTGLESTLAGRVLNFGTLRLRSYNGDLSFPRLPYPEIIFQLLEYQRHHAQRERQQQDQETIRKTLEYRLAGRTIPKRSPQNESNPGLTTTYSNGTFLDWMAKFYGLRQTKSGSVIYRTHWWKFWGKIFLPTLLLVIALVFTMLKVVGLFPSIPPVQAYGGAIIFTLAAWGWWLYQYFDWHNDIYILTPDQLVDVNRKPLGKEERRSAPVKNIQTVQFKRKGLRGLILNYGTVRIQIGNEELTFDDVYDPAAVQAEIFAFFSLYNSQTQKSEQQKMAEWIKTYDEIKQEKPEFRTRDKKKE
jgi:CRP-like cAMP-binding protein